MVSHRHSNFTDAETGWAAGIIDGEGHVALEIRVRNGKTQDVTTVTPTIKVKMACEKTISKLHRYFGCGHVQKPFWDGNPKHKTTYTWKATHGDARHVCRIIEAFCVTKKKEVQAILQHVPAIIHTTAEQAREIRLSFRNGNTFHKLTRQFSLSYSTIRRIVYGELFPDEDKDIPRPKPRKGNYRGRPKLTNS